MQFSIIGFIQLYDAAFRRDSNVLAVFYSEVRMRNVKAVVNQLAALRRDNEKLCKSYDAQLRSMRARVEHMITLR